VVDEGAEYNGRGASNGAAYMMNGPMDTTMPLPAGHGFGGSRLDVETTNNNDNDDPTSISLTTTPELERQQESLMASYRGG